MNNSTSTNGRIKLRPLNGNAPIHHRVVISSTALTKLSPALAAKKKGKSGPRGGAPFGNANHTVGRLFRTALVNVIQRLSPSGRMEALEKPARALYKLAKSGDLQAIRELADRLDGKAAQMIIGDVDQPVGIQDVSDNLTNESRATRLLQMLVLNIARGGEAPPEVKALIGHSKRVNGDESEG